jgi:F-box-like
MPKLKQINPDVDGCFEATLARSLNLSRRRIPIHVALAKHKFSALPPLKRKEAMATLQLERDLRGLWVKNDPDAVKILNQQYEFAKMFVTPISRLPLEILADIFDLALAIGQSRAQVMLVCQYWRNIVILGITSCCPSIELGKWTDPGRVSALLRRARTRHLNITIKAAAPVQPETASGNPYIAFIESMGSASQWRTLSVDSLPEADILDSLIAPGVWFGTPLKQLQSFTISSICEASPLLQSLVENVATAAVGSIRKMDIESPSSLSYFMQPHCTTIFHSLTNLTAHMPRAHGTMTVDILPHLGNLESLDLARILLSLDISGSDLPLTRTLRQLQLKSASFEWMGGRSFPCLASCTIATPHSMLPVIIPSINLPACTELVFNGRQTCRVGLFRVPQSSVVTLQDSSWNQAGGTKEIIHLLRGGWPVGARPRALHLKVLCHYRVLVAMLRENPQLEELSMELPRPGALGRGFFGALLAKPIQQAPNTPNFQWFIWAEQQNDWESTVCPSLRSLDLYYGQPFRPNEQLESLSVLLAVAWSRSKTFPVRNDFSLYLHGLHSNNRPLQLVQASLHTLQSLKFAYPHARLNCEEENPLKFFIMSVFLHTVVISRNNVLTPLAQAIILRRLTRFSCSYLPGKLDILPYFECLEHLHITSQHETGIYPSTVDLPLVHTLRVLSLRQTSIQWLDGRVFSKLQRCSIYEPSDEVSTDFQKIKIDRVDMPVCREMVYHGDYIELLSAFHLPIIENLNANVGQKARPYLNDGWTNGLLFVLKHFQLRVLSIPLFESKHNQELFSLLQWEQILQGLNFHLVRSAKWTQRLLADLFNKTYSSAAARRLARCSLPYNLHGLVIVFPV